jgi:hypothetical protein
MADTKISALAAIDVVAGGDKFGCADASDLTASKSVTADQLKTYIAPVVATQAEQEAGTATTVFTSPGRQHFHPGSAKCWVASTQSSTTIQQSYNVTSVADTGAGVSTVTIATDFSGTTYCVVVGAEHNSASGTTQTYNIDDSGRAAGTYIIQSWQVDGTEALTDPSASWFSVAFGDQA